MFTVLGSHVLSHHHVFAGENHPKRHDERAEYALTQVGQEDEEGQIVAQRQPLDWRTQLSETDSERQQRLFNQSCVSNRFSLNIIFLAFVKTAQLTCTPREASNASPEPDGGEQQQWEGACLDGEPHLRKSAGLMNFLYNKRRGDIFFGKTEYSDPTYHKQGRRYIGVKGAQHPLDQRMLLKPLT